MSINEFKKMLAENNPNYAGKAQVVTFGGVTYKTYSKADRAAKLIIDSKNK